VGLIIEQLCRGTRIIDGKEARARRNLLNRMIDLAETDGFSEIILPSIEPAEIYTKKAGEEILNQMYAFRDRSDRAICLRPEATATIQLISRKHWKNLRDIKLWYFEKCWRYERPQYGRYREFFQFGCEWLNPTHDAKDPLIQLASRMISLVTPNFTVNSLVKRGLSYYIEDGFEISVDALGAQKQVCGGGAYAGGIGFAIGFDRLILC
jgi:histidyl-tRNA synthetase